MSTSLVFTFIATDKPGLIEKLSRIVSSHGGNWLESSMSQLAGQFAGITRVQVSAENLQSLRDALTSLSSEEFTVVVQTGLAATTQEGEEHKLHVIGNDRPGIVREVTAALSARGINVVKMTTQLTSAAMTAEPLFEAAAIIRLGSNGDLTELQDSLDDIAEDLTVDITLE